MGSDSHSYCEKCCHRSTCAKPCAPVEALLDTVTCHEPEYLPQKFINQYIENNGAWPAGSGLKKTLIIYALLEKRLQNSDIAEFADCTDRYVRMVIQSIYEQNTVKTPSELG